MQRRRGRAGPPPDPSEMLGDERDLDVGDHGPERAHGDRLRAACWSSRGRRRTELSIGLMKSSAGLSRGQTQVDFAALRTTAWPAWAVLGRGLGRPRPLSSPRRHRQCRPPPTTAGEPRRAACQLERSSRPRTRPAPPSSSSSDGEPGAGSVSWAEPRSQRPAGCRRRARAGSRPPRSGRARARGSPGLAAGRGPDLRVRRVPPLLVGWTGVAASVKRRPPCRRPCAPTVLSGGPGPGRPRRVRPPPRTRASATEAIIVAGERRSAAGTAVGRAGRGDADEQQRTPRHRRRPGIALLVLRDTETVRRAPRRPRAAPRSPFGMRQPSSLCCCSARHRSSRPPPCARRHLLDVHHRLAAHGIDGELETSRRRPLASMRAVCCRPADVVASALRRAMRTAADRRRPCPRCSPDVSAGASYRSAAHRARRLGPIAAVASSSSASNRRSQTSTTAGPALAAAACYRRRPPVRPAVMSSRHHRCWANI